MERMGTGVFGWEQQSTCVSATVHRLYCALNRVFRIAAFRLSLRVLAMQGYEPASHCTNHDSVVLAYSSTGLEVETTLEVMHTEARNFESPP
jgi:hypothetical protein